MRTSRTVKTPTRLQGGLRRVSRGGLAGPRSRDRVRRPGTAAPAADRVLRDAVLDQPGLGDVPRTDDRCVRVSAEACLRRAEGAFPAEARLGPVDRHDVPDRAALRNRSRHAAYEGRAPARRQLQADRREDLHFLRRARHGGEHRAPGAGAPAGRAARDERNLAIHRAEVRAHRSRRERSGRRAQRPVLRWHRAQDGHSRQRHLPDDPRPRHRLAGRRAQQGAECDVRDDERRSSRRRSPGTRADRGRLSERGGVCEGPHPGPLARRADEPGEARRSDHRASGCAAHAADGACLRGGRTCVCLLGRADGGHAAFAPRRRAAQVRRRHDVADDADREGVHDRQRLPVRVGVPAGLRRPRLCPRKWHGAVSCATPAST